MDECFLTCDVCFVSLAGAGTSTSSEISGPRSSWMSTPLAVGTNGSIAPWITMHGILLVSLTAARASWRELPASCWCLRTTQHTSNWLVNQAVKNDTGPKVSAEIALMVRHHGPNGHLTATTRSRQHKSGSEYYRDQTFA